MTQSVAEAAPRKAVPTKAAQRHRAKASSSSRKARAIRRIGLKDGWTLSICDRPVDRRLGTRCTNVASISRQSPEIALKLAEAVNRIAQERRGQHEGKLSVEDVLAELTREPELLGCRGSGRKRGAVYLAGRHMGAMTSKRRGMDRRVGKACDAANDGGRDGISIATAVGEWRDAVTSERAFYEDWLDESVACGDGGGRRSGGGRGNTMMQGAQDDDAQAGEGDDDAQAAQQDAATDAAQRRSDASNSPPQKPSQIRVFVGKLWGKVTSAAGVAKPWKPDTKNAVTGGRGYCFADADCANSCHSNALARTLAKELVRTRYSGCDDNATPAPGSTKTCHEVLDTDRITGAMREQLWHEACAARGGVEQPCADSSVCAVQCLTPDELEVTERSFDVCGDPRAMCGPDDVGGWPGEDPPQPGTGPRRKL